jgi:hypothetical protein
MASCCTNKATHNKYIASGLEASMATKFGAIFRNQSYHEPED